MGGTFEGLGVPLSGAFKRYASNGTTQILDVDSSNAWNYTYADPGADNLFAITVTDATTVTSGYLQTYYANVTTSGSYSTGSTQINVFAVDLLLGGTIACEAEGMYIYVAKSGSPTLTSANINGINIYLDDFGSSPSSRACIQLHIADGNVASGQDAFIVMRLEGASGVATNMFQKSGTATNPEYFMQTNAADGMVTAYSASDSATKALRFRIGSDVYNIPMVPDSCS